jgi:hypothetical protein
MAKLKSFAPEHFVPDAQASGFYQCRDLAETPRNDALTGMGFLFMLSSFAGPATSPSSWTGWPIT